MATLYVRRPLLAGMLDVLSRDDAQNKDAHEKNQGALQRHARATRSKKVAGPAQGRARPPAPPCALLRGKLQQPVDSRLRKVAERLLEHIADAAGAATAVAAATAAAAATVAVA